MRAALYPGAEALARAARREERRVGPLDIDATVLYGLDVFCDLDDLARPIRQRSKFFFAVGQSRLGNLWQCF